MDLKTIVVWEGAREDDPIVVDRRRLVQVGSHGDRLTWGTNPYAHLIFIAVRNAGPLANHAFYLDGTYDWVLGRDETNNIILAPLRKDQGRTFVDSPTVKGP